MPDPDDPGERAGQHAKRGADEDGDRKRKLLKLRKHAGGASKSVVEGDVHAAKA